MYHLNRLDTGLIGPVVLEIVQKHTIYTMVVWFGLDIDHWNIIYMTVFHLHLDVYRVGNFYTLIVRFHFGMFHWYTFCTMLGWVKNICHWYIFGTLSAFSRPGIDLLRIVCT